MPRNYRKEYDNYQGKPEQIKRRSSRNKARRKMKNEGRLKPGMDVDHKNRNPMDNSPSNRRMQSKSKNRSRNK